jgi:hypothetical protein
LGNRVAVGLRVLVGVIVLVRIMVLVGVGVLVACLVAVIVGSLITVEEQEVRKTINKTMKDIVLFVVFSPKIIIYPNKKARTNSRALDFASWQDRIR